jgi:hypothetical protein
MTSIRTCFGCLCVTAGLLAASPASAQSTQKPTPKPASSSRISASINFGVQAGSGDLTYGSTPLIYDEPARLDVAQTFESGPLFDIGGSYLIYDNFGVGLSYSRTSGDGVATVTGQIPDPDVTDRPRGASASADGLAHTENAVHLQVFYRFAATPKLDISVGLGPTFYSMTQDLIDTVDVAEPGPTITPRPAEVSESPVGFNIGADATYMINERFGAGVLLRIATGSADMALPSGGSVEVDAGGFQFAVGLRVRF